MLGLIIFLFTIGVHTTLIVFLQQQLGSVAGLTIYCLFAILTTAAAGVLLSGLTVETVTWRNRLAGILLPWSRFVGGDPLMSFLVKNALISIVFGVTVVIFNRMQLFHITSSNGDGPTIWANIVAWLTVCCWLVMGIAWIYILRSIIRNRSDVVSVLLGKQGNGILLVVPPLAIGISLYLHNCGYLGPALLVVAIPLFYFLLPVSLMVLVILIHQLTGKPIRWN